MPKISLLGAVAIALIWISPAVGQVSIAVNVTPPPPLVVATPPALVLVPGTTVYHVPGATFNLFVFNGQYYSFHNGAWFLAPSHNGPWKAIAADRVPRAVAAVPNKYYKVPPGHAKKMDDDGERGERGPGRGHKGKK